MQDVEIGNEERWLEVFTDSEECSLESESSSGMLKRESWLLSVPEGDRSVPE